MQPLSPHAGCVTALNLKPEALLAFKNGPAFTLKSDKVIWIRENQCTAETPAPHHWHFFSRSPGAHGG